MIRAVIDTNVVISAMISPSGNEALLLLAVNQNLVGPCFSLEILREYEDVLRRPFDFGPDEMESLLDVIRRRRELVPLIAAMLEVSEGVELLSGFAVP